jgi:hypothetical protein
MSLGTLILLRALLASNRSAAVGADAAVGTVPRSESVGVLTDTPSIVGGCALGAPYQ